MNFKVPVLIVFLLSVAAALAQLPRPLTSSEIFHEIQKLQVTGNVLYVAAHPDDENTRLISWLANEKKVRTGYLSLTRGDGGQNLIGDEQGAELGMIRTQELLAARRIDGGEQFFTRATDFGYSKTPAETFKKWDKEKVLGDMVFIIRYFQPDIVITRFPADGRGGHGHHTASAILANEAYEAAANPARFPEHMNYGLKPWQIKRVLWNSFNFGNTNTIDSTQVRLEVGQFKPLLGVNIGELAGESRSQHKSQGFGASRQRGHQNEYFTLTRGDKMGQDIFEGIDLTWARINDTEDVAEQIDEIIKNYNFNDPSASVKGLLRLRSLLMRMPQHPQIDYKKEQVKKLILACAGVYAEMTTNQAIRSVSDSVEVTFSIVNRGNARVELLQADFGSETLRMRELLEPNEMVTKHFRTNFTSGMMETQPYWLREGMTHDMYQISNLDLLKSGANDPLSGQMVLFIEDHQVNVNMPLMHRQVDPVKGELYNPVYITENFLLFNHPGLILFKQNSTDSARAIITVQRNGEGELIKPGVRLKSKSADMDLKFRVDTTNWRPGNTRTVNLRLSKYLEKRNLEQDYLEITFSPDLNKEDLSYHNAMRTIQYDHIPTQSYHYVDALKVLNLDLKLGGKSIGYIAGAGDKVAEMLRVMGYQVTDLKEGDLRADFLAGFDAIVTGVRAYNVNEYLGELQPVLLDYVKQGGNLVVQYNTNSRIGPLERSIAPYPFAISRNRITDEHSQVQFRLPKHPVLNFPNKITQNDFKDWVQERSIYEATDLDETQWALPFAMRDEGEEATNGSLAIAKYGKGNFVYAGMVFFRQLPMGVPGSFRLMANILALPQNK